MINFYSKLFTESGGWRPIPEGLPMHSIGEEDCRWLEGILRRVRCGRWLNI
jgi:hypothetical protein